MSAETQKVDVHAELLRQGVTGKVIKAVADLIEADIAFDMARRNFAPCSDEVLEASVRRSAALARVGGAA